MLTFKANEKQILKLFQKAFEASKPVGMGFIQHVEGYEFNFHDLLSIESTINGDTYFSVDYYKGRMMKMEVRKRHDFWTINNYSNSYQKPKIEYQSFADVYDTWPKLLKAAGITEIEMKQD